MRPNPRFLETSSSPTPRRRQNPGGPSPGAHLLDLLHAALARASAGLGVFCRKVGQRLLRLAATCILASAWRMEHSHVPVSLRGASSTGHLGLQAGRPAPLTHVCFQRRLANRAPVPARDTALPRTGSPAGAGSPPGSGASGPSLKRQSASSALIRKATRRAKFQAHLPVSVTLLFIRITCWNQRESLDTEGHKDT